tara:strand:+ start:7286 stop:7750 length:465 start_codon:yes stop_codon:yes gene_type:complete
MPRSYLGYVNHQFTSCAWQQVSHEDAVTEAVRAYVSQWSTEFESGQLDWTVLPVFVLDDSKFDSIHWRIYGTEVRKDLGNGSNLCQNIERHGWTEYTVTIPKMGRCKKANYNAPCYTAKLKVACLQAMNTACVVEAKDNAQLEKRLQDKVVSMC